MKTIMSLKGCLLLVGSLVLVLAVLAFPKPGWAQTSPGWHSNGPYGGNVIGFDVGKDGGGNVHLFAAARDAVYWSTDRGNTWFQTLGLEAQFVTTSPDYVHDTTVFMGNRWGDFKRSSDGGENWTSINISSRAYVVSFSPDYAVDRTMFMGGDGIFKSSNGGVNWTRISDGPFPPAYLGLAVSPNYPMDHTLYASGGNGIYKSTDDGLTWIAVLSSGWCRSLVFSPDYENDHTLLCGTFKTTDEGATWNQYMPGFYAGVLTIAFSPDYVNDGIIYVGGEFGVFKKSTDKGATWTQLESGILGAAITRLVVSPDYVTDNTVYGGTWAGVIKSVDEGTTWNFTNQLILEHELNKIKTSLNYEYDNRVYTAGWGLLISNDGGQSWDRTKLPWGNVYAYEFSPNFDQDGTAFVMMLYSSFRTTDGGNTWVQLERQSGYGGFAFSPGYAQDQTVFQGTSYYGVFKSMDGGETWQDVNQNGLPSGSITKMAISPNYSQDQTLYVVRSPDGFSQKRPYKTIDGGISWTEITEVTGNVTNILISPDYMIDHTVMMVSSSALYLSEDSGQTWTSITGVLWNIEPDSWALSPYFSQDHTIYQVSSHDVRASHDKGYTWEILTLNGEFSNIELKSIATGKNGNGVDVFVASANGSVWQNTYYPPYTAPTANAGSGYEFVEGSSGQLDGSGSADPDQDNTTLTYEWDVDYDGVNFDVDVTGIQPTVSFPDNFEARTIGLRVTDLGGLTDLDTTSLQVMNVAPVVGAITAPTSPQAINTVINTSANFSDAGTLDTHIAVWNWGDNSTSGGTVTESNGSGTVTGNHTYTSAGVYTVTLTVTDDDLASGTNQFMYVVVYNPAGGFVTGAGRFDAPAGSIPSEPTQSGMTNFGTNAKYVNNVLTGSTRLNFKDGQYVFDFDSTSYDWLVITNGNFARLHGSGNVNGIGGYTFELTALDSSPDTIRMKIWDGTNTIVYDNNTTPLSNGNIKVHN